MRKILIGCMVCWLITGTAAMVAIAQAKARDSMLEQQQGVKGEQMLIGDGDLLEVSVYGVTDFNQQVRVSQTGEVSLPMIGVLKISGLSITDAEKIVRDRLVQGGFFNDPQVSIFEKEYATQGVSILGEVQKPGVYPLLGSRTLFDAISAAGGTTPKAGSTAIITHRNHPEQPKTIALPYDEAGFSSGNNVPILPGDTILVSKAGIVYVVGDVRQPSGFVMDKQLTVLQVVALAQGANATAALGNAKLIRKTDNGVTEIPVSLKRIMESRAPDIQVKAEDILFVPSSAAKTGAKRGLDAILQAAVGVAIYRP
jgi:polysaccharide biosynthesis/export protein